MIEEVASLGVSVDGHVLFRARDGTASCDLSQKVPERFRVERVAEGKEAGEEDDLFIGEVVEGSEVSGLVDL